MSKYKWSGLDEDAAAEQENYIMRKFWCDGTIAARQESHTGILVFTPYAAGSYDLYDFPSTVSLINHRGVSQALIPAAPQTVNKDVVLGWCQPSHKPIVATVRYYIDRIVQVELIVNTNLCLQNLPFLVAVSEEDQEKMADIVDRILQNEVVVFAGLEDLQKIQTMATQTPYIIDKLNSYRKVLEDELLAFLGIDNTGGDNFKSHLTVDVVNANNDLINEYNNIITAEINKWLDGVNKLFGRNISIKDAVVPEAEKVRSIHDGGMKDEEISE